MYNKLVITLVAILALVSIGVASNVQAKFGKVVGIETESVKITTPKFSVIECDQGEKVLSDAGFIHVFATKCSGVEYRFNGFRGGNEYSIIFNARSNGFAAISR